MALSKTSKTGLVVVLGLGAAVWITTIVVFLSFTNTDSRDGDFLFAFGYISFLELLAFGYFAVPFIPAIRQRLVTALYPAFGIVIGLYIARALIMSLATHTVPFLNSPRSHMISALFGLLPFLVLMGILLVLNVWQREQTDAIRAERADLAVLGSSITEIYQNFLNSRTYLEEAGFQVVEPLLKKLKERFQFCTPFHREPPGAPQIGDEIQQGVASLKEKIERLSTITKEEKPTVTESLRLAVIQLLQLMERREKLLVK